MVRATRSILVTFLAALVAGPALSQQLMIYPKKGQSEEQQAKDRFECHNFAVQQTGFDPQNVAAAPPPAQAQQGGALRGAARGAATGAVVGAIAGDAGKGAAIGAAGGGMVGGMRRRDADRQAQQQQANAQAAVAQQQANFNRAVGACLEGRGYSVK